MSLKLFTLCLLVATAAARAGDDFDLIAVSGERSGGGGIGLATLHPTNGAFGSLRFSFNSASISRDGTRIAYGWAGQLHVANLDGTDDQIISTNTGPLIRWSPLGDRLGVLTGSDIRIVSLAGVLLQTLTSDTNGNRTIYAFDWSPDGSEIVYSQTQGVRIDIPDPPANGVKFVLGTLGQIKIVTLASGESRLVHETKEEVAWIDRRWALRSMQGVSPVGFRWSPQGNNLVVGHYVSKRAFRVVDRPATPMPSGVEDEQRSLAILDLESGAIRHLVVSHWSDITAGFPAWSRDGSRIVYRAVGPAGSVEDGIYIVPDSLSAGDLPPLGSHSPLGDRVAGAATFPGGRNAVPLDWVIPNPEVVSFTAPAPDELVPRGKPYTIRFTAHPTIAAVDLHLVRTRNPDGPRELLAQGVPAAGGQHVWEVPEEMETPSTFIVAVDSSDPSREGTSQRFRVRQPWRLHRIIGTFNEPKYERISSLDHSWRFDQTDENMWPEAYWDHPYHTYWDIRVGFDPLIGQDVRYDPVIFSDPHFFYEDTWPPWPALGRAFGIPGAYLSPDPWIFNGIRMHQPNREAAGKWEFEVLLRSDFHGVCYGLSLSMMAAFQDPERFDAKWLPGGNSRELGKLLPSSPGVRDAAHALQLYTWGRLDESERARNALLMTPRDVVDRLKDMFERDDRYRDRFLVIEGTVNELDGSGNPMHAAHAMVPYGMAKLDETTYEIGVYDPNFGSTGNEAIIVDIAENSWWHSDDYWDGDVGQGLFLSTEAIRVFEPASSPWPHVFEPSPSGNRVAQSEEAPDTLSVQIVGSAGAVISPAGELRYERGVRTQTLPGGYISFPITGRPSQPDNYLVPGGAPYRAEVDPRTNGTAAIRISGGAVAMTLRQTGAAPGDRLEADLLGDGMVVVRGGPGRFELSAQVFVEPGEFRSIRVVDLATPDPAGLRLTADQDGFRLVGPAGSSTYHLQLDHSNSEGRRIFHGVAIPLEGGTTHTLHPVWSAVNGPVVNIAVDRDGDGQTDETLAMENQAPSPTLWPGWRDGTDRLHLEVRNSSASVPEIKVAAPSTQTFEVEWSHDAIRWTRGRRIPGGAWIPIPSLQDLVPETVGPLFLRVRR